MGRIYLKRVDEIEGAIQNENLYDEKKVHSDTKGPEFLEEPLLRARRTRRPESHLDFRYICSPFILPLLIGSMLSEYLSDTSRFQGISQAPHAIS